MTGGGRSHITLISAYLPASNSKHVTEDLKNLFQWVEQLEGEIILGADLNAHHDSWSPEFPECPRGKLISQITMDSKMILLNDGSPTMCLAPGNRRSAIDLTWVTEGLARKAKWEVLDEEFGSAHLTIRIGIGDEIPLIEKTSKRVNQDRVIKSLNEMRPQYIYNPEEMQEIFEETLEKASYIVKNKKGNYLKRWWNNELALLYNGKREALRRYNRNKTQNNYVDLQKRRAMFKKEFRKTKRAYIKDLSEKIDETTPPKQVWNIVKGIDTNLNGNHRKSTELSYEKGAEFMNYYFGNKLSPVSCPKVETERNLEGFEIALKEDEILRNLKKKKKKNL
ncbi:uncharacterized protein LOC110675129 [Aedes aegypti]|uniref:Endonuclease/exonuclease/phosphatase domain-containing protein n=1 Tax=Aedes aegypti TaxID=7159 RepID=A0A6I8U355_AEDAE|nr:uncharacterized protein LOC110675129 [Aedes aegypti]